MSDAPERIYAWVYRDGDRMLASCICAVSPCGPFQTEYVRADLAVPLDDPRVEALVDLIKRAEHNIPEYYTLWHADARAALEAIASPSIATPLNDPRVKALVEALKEAERMLKHYGSRDAGGMAQIRAALSALEENK